MFQYILLVLVYITTILLVVKLGYGGIANIVEFRERRIKVNPLSKILFEISIFIFLSHYIFRPYAVLVSLSVLIAIFYILRDKLSDLSLYFLAYFTITLWAYSNSAHFYGIPLYFWPHIFTVLFGYSRIVTAYSYLYGLFESLLNPVLFITFLGFVFIATTNTSELIRSFSELRIPLSITLIFSVFIKIIPQSLRQMDLSYKLQIARGLGYNKPLFLKPFYYVYTIILVIFPTLVYLIRNSRNLAIALDTRGFRAYKRRTSLVRIGMRKLDYVLLVCSALLLYLSF